MTLKTCIALVLAIMGGSYCIPSTSVEVSSSSWGYEYNLNNSNGIGASYDKNNGFQVFPLEKENNTGYHKKYTEKTVHDEYTSNDGQPPTRKLTVNEYVETNKPAPETAGKPFRNPSGTSPDYSKKASSTPISTTTSSPHIDVRGGPNPPSNRVTSTYVESGIPMNKEPSHQVQSGTAAVGQSGSLANNVPSPHGQSRTPVDDPGNQGHATYSATYTSPHYVLVGNLPDTSNAVTYNTPYGYNVPPYKPMGAPVYKNPNPMYGVPGHQMYMSWQRPTGSAYGPAGSTAGSAYGATVSDFGSSGPAYGPTGFAYRPTGYVNAQTGSASWQKPTVSAYGPVGSAYGPNGPGNVPTGSAYGPTGPAYQQASSSSWSTQGQPSGQTYGPGYDQTFNMARKPMYGVQQRIYY